MAFGRWAIVEGWYWYALYWHGGASSHEYKQLCRVSRYFKPGPSLNGPETEEAREVYAQLVEKYQPNACGYNPCGCRDCFETVIGPRDVTICDECSDAGCEPFREQECQREDAYDEDTEEESA